MTSYSIRVVLPYHLSNLAKVGHEIVVEVDEPVTACSVVDAVEALYPNLCGTIRDHQTKRRRPLLRYFVCAQDMSHEPEETRLPEAVLNGAEPFIIWGAIAGG